ncbi:MAG: EF-hand domain-containing protein [Planctomycetia bacterium]|nr:EF-hand domain-containing protein [Planctomycetia bacterium]
MRKCRAGIVGGAGSSRDFASAAILLAAIWGCGQSGPPLPAPPPRPVAIAPAVPPPPKTVAPEDLLPIEAPDPPEAAPDFDPTFDPALATEKLLVFTPRGPVIVQLEMAIDGWPFREAREGLIENMLRRSDTNGDGRLTWEEALASPHFGLGNLARFRAMPPQEQQERIRQWDANHNGLVERSEVETFVNQLNNAGKPFSLDAGGEADRDRLNRQFWRLADADRDKTLSEEEIDGLVAALLRLDTSADELLQQDELAPPETAAERRMRMGFDVDIRFEHLTENTKWYNVRSGMGPFKVAGKIVPESFPLDPTLVRRLDANENGIMDDKEAANLLYVDPHLVVAVHFGESPDRPPGVAVRRIWHTLGRAEEVVKAVPDGLVIKLPGAELRVMRSDIPGLAAAKSLADAQLARLDGNKDGYLVQDELGGEAVAEQFRELDVNGDGKLYVDELIAGVVRQQAPQATRIRASMASVPHDLFAIVDANGDGMLFLREVKNAPDRILRLDANGDGRVTQDEVADTLVLSLRRGGETMTMPLGPDVPFPPAPGAQTRDDLPAWFHAMDVNGDGELSRREFLGNALQFGRLDRNGDDFIDAAEAKGEPASDRK